MRRPVSLPQPPGNNRAARQPNDTRQKKQRHRLCLLLAVLLLASGIWLLHRLSFPSAAADRIIRPDLTEAQKHPAALPPPPSVPLRGTIYDRNLEELAVSCRLYSLQAHPAELADRRTAAKQLAAAAGADAEELFRRLLSGEQTVELAGSMDMEQAKAAEALKLPGVSCRPVESRYYPGHAAGGKLLGFVSEGAGLSGAEALYDSLLQPGPFRPVAVPEIDFAGKTSLGPQAADLVLTLDLQLQKRLEKELRAWRQRKGAVSGSALALDPETGRLLAAVRQPGLDPNYFWQTSGPPSLSKEDSPLFPAEFFPALLEPLLAETQAAQEAGLGGPALPATVRMPRPEFQAAAWHEFGFDQPVPDLLPLDFNKQLAVEKISEDERLSAADIAVDAASLLNGGKRVRPWFLKAVYDPDRQQFFSHAPEANPPKRLIAPAAGVQLRRWLLHDSFWGSRQGFLFVNSISAALAKNNLSERHLQDLLIAAVPQDRPRLLLVLAVEYGALYPQPPGIDPAQDQETLAELGRTLLPILAKYVNESKLPKQPPAAQNKTNLRRFLLSRRLNRPTEEEKDDEQAPQIMPNLVGLSLRQALRRLNPHKLRVRIRGGGRVVAQQPKAKASLTQTDTCELRLKPLFKEK